MNFIGEAEERLSLPSKGLMSCGKVKGKSQKEWYLPGMSKDISLGHSFTCLCPGEVGAGHTGLLLQVQISLCLLGQLVHLSHGA